MANYVYIATENDGLDWLEQFPNPDQNDYGFTEFFEQIDALVMGRRTFEVVSSFNAWPYTKPVFVLTHQLLTVASTLDGKVDFVSGSLDNIINQLAQQGFDNLYIDGGQTITQFLQADLIDHLIITRLPILLGQGIPLFGNLARPMLFEHQKTNIYHNNLIKSHYIRKRC